MILSQKGRTPDEKFLIQLYFLAKEANDLFVEIEIDQVLKKQGFGQGMGKTIVRDLAQANFVKKRGDQAIVLTQQGISFVEKELED